MRRINFPPFQLPQTIALLLLSALPLAAQRDSVQRPGTIMSGSSTTMSNGAGVRMSYSTVVDPADQVANVRMPGGASGNPLKAWHRFMIDQVHGQYFGYDLTVSPGLSPGHFTVTIAPLSVGPQDFGMRMTGVDPNVLRSVPLPSYPPPQDVQDGDTISLDLLVSPDGKTKVTDYLQVWNLGGTSGAGVRGSTGAPRDYSLDDGVPHFNWQGVKVTVNGQPAAETGFTGRPGVTLWLTDPNHGRYVLSLLPHEGFQKAGTIHD